MNVILLLIELIAVILLFGSLIHTQKKRLDKLKKKYLLQLEIKNKIERDIELKAIEIEKIWEKINIEIERNMKDYPN